MNRIKKLRELRGIGGPELAEKLGISTQYLYDLENGRRRLNEGLIIKLCQIFGVSSDYLLGIDTPEENQERNGLVFFGSSRFAKLSPESRKTILQLIDRLYEAERGQKTENEAGDLGPETNQATES